VQVDEVEGIAPVLSPRFQDQTGGKREAAVYVPAGRPHDRNSGACKTMSGTVPGGHQIEKIDLVPKAFKKTLDMGLNASRHIVTETAKTEYAHVSIHIRHCRRPTRENEQEGVKK
jgi:hypothetical protein